jgi:FkbM family methyltransferase
MHVRSRNPIVKLAAYFNAWRSFRSHSGVFTLSDACRRMRQVVQPQRFTEREMMKYVADELEIKPLSEGVYDINVRRHGLRFVWAGTICGGLAAAVQQEFDETHPHNYTTPPIRLTPASVILDVGACEGLFASRAVRQYQVKKVICFEPSARTAVYLRRGAEINGTADRIETEICAVGPRSGSVYFTDSAIPEGNKVVDKPAHDTKEVRQVSLDDYCDQKQIRLTRTDLIKVDAEGADVGVIKGAERIIRHGAPQIAVTTYHHPDHAAELIAFLRQVQPGYRLRLKGLAYWGEVPKLRPVLLQAALPPAEPK